jgi:hypothetical protein
MSFATLFKPSAQSVLTVAKNIDTNLEKFCSLLASELKLDSSVNVKDAFVKCMHVFETDEQKKKDEEARLKEEKKKQREAEKLARDEKKKQEELEKEEKKKQREVEKLARDEKKKQEELAKEEKKKLKEEEKKKKEEEKKEKELKKDEKKEIKCDDCDKTIRKPKEIDGKSVCSDCHKKIEKEIKEKNKVPCSHVGKDNKKCSLFGTTESGLCKRHSKGTSSGSGSASESEKKSPSKKIELESENVKNGFDFEEESINPFDAEDDFWTGKSIKIEGKKCKLTKTGIVYYMEDGKAVFYGIRNGDELEEEDGLSDDIKDWMIDSGLVVKSKCNDVELDLE